MDAIEYLDGELKDNGFRQINGMSGYYCKSGCSKILRPLQSGNIKVYDHTYKHIGFIAIGDYDKLKNI